MTRFVECFAGGMGAFLKARQESAEEGCGVLACCDQCGKCIIVEYEGYDPLNEEHMFGIEEGLDTECGLEKTPNFRAN